jgi:hypothetical protein
MRDSARNARMREPMSRPVFLGSLLSVLDATGDLPPAFQELRQRFDQAKARFDAGDLSAERYANLLAALRCFDSDGRSWSIGASSGLWYRLIDDAWVQSPPPYQSASAISSAESLYRTAVEHARTPAALPAAPDATGATGATGGEADATGGGEELLFGLPTQLFASEAMPQGPVPHGALPELDAPGGDPSPRSPDGDERTW